MARGIEGMVLTEWKTAEDAKSAVAAFGEARAQADLYSQGALAGIELTTHRYLIVLTPKELPPGSIPADDRTASGIIYRHVNIVVEPTVPSIVARKLARAAKK
jgi:hypothetical protein